MNHYLQFVKDQGIPLNVGAAAQHLGMSDYGIGQQSNNYYIDNIKELSGETLTETNPDKLRTIYARLVTAVIKTSDNVDTIIDIKTLLTHSIEQTEEASHLPGFNKQTMSEAKTDADGNPKQKKGAKMALATEVYDKQIKDKNLSRKDAIAIMVEAGVSSPAGCSTYYAKLKKGES